MSQTSRALFAEFVGTYLLVLTVGCNVMFGSPVWGALSIASVLMVSIYALGSVSGGHFNPAVSLAVHLSERGAKNPGLISSRDGLFKYWIAQFFGGIAAGLSYARMGPVFELQPGTGFGVAAAGSVELLYTFLLCFVVLRAAVRNPDAANEFYGLAIGFCIVAGGYAGGYVSKGCFNPAVAVGIDVASGKFFGSGWCGLYGLFEFSGAALAWMASEVVDAKSTYSEGIKVFAAEFIGTFFLVLTVALNILGASPAGALSIAASLMSCIYALAGTSGAHFNPAVTAALTLAKKSKANVTALYMAAQIVGGIAAGVVATTIDGKTVPLHPAASASWGECAYAEMIYTFVLCFTVLNVAAIATPSKQIYGLAIGFCVVVGGFAVGGISGGALNPAVAFGLDTSHALKEGSWINCLPYSVFEFTGAALAAGLYGVVRPEEVKAIEAE